MHPYKMLKYIDFTGQSINPLNKNKGAWVYVEEQINSMELLYIEKKISENKNSRGGARIK